MISLKIVSLLFILIYSFQNYVSDDLKIEIVIETLGFVSGSGLYLQLCATNNNDILLFLITYSPCPLSIVHCGEYK